MIRSISLIIANTRIKRIALGIIIILALIFYYWGIASVPFHPDESTYIFMSSDFLKFFSSPSSLFWQDEPNDVLRQHYREIDPPLTRDLIGAGLAITGLKPLSNDWDWTLTWEENLANNALPSENQLLVGRLSVAWLFLPTLLLFFMVGQKLSSKRVGILASFFLLTNALILLHTRRAMEEGPLIFGICLSLWGLLNLDKGPWLAAFGAALAFNAKQSALVIVPVVLLGILWTRDKSESFSRRLIYSASFLGIFVAITFLLNPFLWSNPIQAAKDAVASRLELVQSQVNSVQGIAPQQVLNTPGERLVGMIAQLFVAPPAIQDIGNYTQALSIPTANYLGIYGVDLFRGIFWGGLLMLLTLLGVTSLLLKIIKNGLHEERLWALFLISFLIQVLGLLIAVPIPYQRYWVPLVPYVCFFSAKGVEMVTHIIQLFVLEIKRKRSLAM